MMGPPSCRKKILLLVAAPADGAHLRLELEIREIEESLRHARLREDFEFRPVLAVRTRDLQQALLIEQPQIVHFSGHGNNKGVLLVEDDNGNAHPVHPDVLAELFSLCRDHVECVLLNACYAEPQAEAISAYIPYVIGSSGALDDRAALAFSIGFYCALGEGKPYTDAYLFGRSTFRLDFPHLPPPLLKENTQLATSAVPPMRDKVFISYSHKDRMWLDRLQTMLAPLFRNSSIARWDDTQIQAGARWRQEVERALASAKVAVLLVSDNFLASQFIAERELPPLLSAAETQGLKILWVYVSYCLWEETPLADYQAAHAIGRSLDDMSEAEAKKVLAEVCRRIKAAAGS
jgi:TIR domain-containing protein